MNKIELDKSSFKALASETRIEIIKTLSQKSMRVTDLSKEIELSKPTILEHLRKLEESGLVEKEKQGEKWIYYSLTKKSENLLEPKINTRVKILIVTSIISLIGGLTQLFNYLNHINGTNQNNEQITIQTAENIAQTTKQPGSLWEAILLIGVAITLITISILYYKSQTPLTK